MSSRSKALFVWLVAVALVMFLIVSPQVHSDAHYETGAEPHRVQRHHRSGQFNPDDRREKKSIVQSKLSDGASQNKPVCISTLLASSTSPKNNAKSDPKRLAQTVDGMIVLRESVLATMQGKPYDFEFIALRFNFSHYYDKVLEFAGWRFVDVQLPLLPHDIKNTQIANEVITDGALGLSEILKLEALRMTYCRVVIMMDVDAFFLAPFDALATFKESFGFTHGNWKSEPVNGGFLVFNPNVEGVKHYTAILDVLREGDFRDGTGKGGPGVGWKGSGIGWTYGGRTVQGLLPYYYMKVLNGSAHKELNHCEYNNMATLPECNAIPLSEIRSVHFTGDCMKPWDCLYAGAITKHCVNFTSLWTKGFETAVTKYTDLASKALTAGATLPPRLQEPTKCVGGRFSSLAEWLLSALP